MMSRVRVGLLALLLATGCREVTAPGAEVGTYALIAVGDAPLPVVFSESQDGGIFSLVADTITLDGRGGVARVSVMSIRNSSYRSDTVITSRSNVEYRRSGGQAIAVGTFYCPPNANCAAPQSGALLPDGMRLDTWSQGETRDGWYRRLP